MFSTVVNISKVFGNLKLRGNSKVKRSHLGHSNNLCYILSWHHEVAIQFGKCIALTHITHFKSCTFIVRRRVRGNTNEIFEVGVGTPFNARNGSRPLWTGWISICKTANRTPVFSSQLDIDTCMTMGEFCLFSPTSPTWKVKDIYYFLRKLQVLHRHCFHCWENNPRLH